MRRHRIAELMDDPGIDRGEHEHALRSLNRINRWSGVDRLLADILRDSGAIGGSIVDIGCGGGGFLASVAEDARLRPPMLLGVDRSPFAVQWAARGQSPRIHWLAGDARALPLVDRSADVVSCSLFLHHFDEPQVLMILREADRIARKAVVIADLVRSRLAWAVTWLATRVLSRSRVFHIDGPRSVRAAFTADELADLARDAGLTSVTLRKCFPLRVVLVATKGPARAHG